MTSARDADYKMTKLIKRGVSKIQPDLQPMADWISNEYKVPILNLYYDTIKSAHDKPIPRLNIIFEHHIEAFKFQQSPSIRVAPDKTAAITHKFDELVNGPYNTPGLFGKLRQTFGHKKYATDGLFIIFDTFEKIAKDEANDVIPHAEIKELIFSMKNPDLWEISRFGIGTTAFFYTDEQKRKHAANGFQQLLTDKYFWLLKKYDEFGYIGRDAFHIAVDSKENLDNNYQGNWYYYYK